MLPRVETQRVSNRRGRQSREEILDTAARVMGQRGYAAARARFHWPVHAERFVAQLEAWAGRSPSVVPDPVIAPHPLPEPLSEPLPEAVPDY